MGVRNTISAVYVILVQNISTISTVMEPYALTLGSTAIRWNVLKIAPSRPLAAFVTRAQNFSKEMA